MSYLGWRPQLPQRSVWQWFPWWIAGAMGVVIAVNIGMVYAALHSFPGKAGDNEFELSNHYDQVLAQVQRDAALGWSMNAQADAMRRPVVVLAYRSGAPLTGARVTATAERPLGAAEEHALLFREISAGRYVADWELPLPGQWELLVSASAQGHDVAATRRIIVR